MIRAAASFVHEGLGTALLVGREEPIRQSAKNLGIELGKGIEIINAALSKRNSNYAAYLYERLQRQGYLLRDVPAPDQPGPQSLSPPAWWRSTTPTPW